MLNVYRQNEMNVGGENLNISYNVWILANYIKKKHNCLVYTTHQNHMVAHNLEGAFKLQFKEVLCTTSDRKNHGHQAKH